MLFNSLHFLIFFPVVVLAYVLVPAKCRYLWLLAASYYFYMSWNPRYAILIGISTATTYGCALILERIPRERTGGRRWWMFLSILTLPWKM